MMKHSSIVHGATLLGAVLCAAAGCEEDQVLTTTRNLDRPGPMAMVCAARVGDAGVTTGLSPSACTPDGGTGTLYGFVANTSKGEVALFRPAASGEPLVDLDRGSPGFGFIPVGSLPSAMEATGDGCRVVTANRGSCDLSMINVPDVLRVAAEESDAPHSGVVARISPHTKSGVPLRARPQDLVLLPHSHEEGAVCSAKTAYQAYVTFPRCNLVAQVDLGSGEIVQALVVRHDGFILTDEPRCAPECALRGDDGVPDGGPLDYGPLPDAPLPADMGQGGEAAAADAALDAGVVDATGEASAATDSQPLDAGLGADGPTDAGAPGDGPSDGAGPAATGDVLPFGLALLPGGERLYVSSAGAGFISVVDVAADTGAFEAARRVPLDEGVGTTVIRLSPAVARLGGSTTEEVRFLYAVATDRSVRVISTVKEHECETNLDLGRVDAGSVPVEQGRCFAVGGPDTPPRRVSQIGTGLRFGQRAPVDVVFVKSQLPPPDAGVVGDAGHEDTPLRGIFALVALSDGAIYVVDVVDWNVVQQDSTTLDLLRLPHRFRNRLQGTAEGVPDASITAVSNSGSGGVPVIVSETPAGGGDAGAELPGQGIFLRAPGEAVASTWRLVYEDKLVDRWSGNLVLKSDRLSLDDPGANYCRAGVLGMQSDGQQRQLRHGDIVVLSGCEDDNDCGLDQKCVKPVTQQTEFGLCFDSDRKDELFQRCAKFLRGDREFRVVRASQDRLWLDALPVEPQAALRQPQQPAGGCGSNPDCAAGYYCALEGRPELGLAAGDCFRPGCTGDADCGSGHCVTPLAGGPKVCAPVPLPLEVDAQGPGCSSDADCAAPSALPSSCDSDRDCGSSLAECRRASSDATSKSCVSKAMVCAAFPGLKGRCVRRSPCFNELLRYEVRAGRSFLVGGYKRVKADETTGDCVQDSSKDPLLAQRIPVGLAAYPVLSGPPCSGPVTPVATPSPNPCFERSPAGYVGILSPGTSPPLTVTWPDTATVVRFANPDIWFGMGLSHLSNVQATTEGTDAGVGTTFHSNMPERELTIELSVTSGHDPLRLATNSLFALPARLVDGPDEYVYLVDLGDLSGSTGANGQVRRLERATLLLDDFIVR